LTEGRGIVSELKVMDVRVMPGKHDASVDSGAAYKKPYGETHYSFHHKRVHFVVLDNVSDPGANVRETQLQWLKADLARLGKSPPIVVFTPRLLFDLAPAWDWAIRDGAKAIEILMAYPDVPVFCGHIHRERLHQTGHIAHRSAKSLNFPLPVPTSQPIRTPLPLDAA
jgi:3',5'-cyclic AMP phosphodiesterase CpdA